MKNKIIKYVLVIDGKDHAIASSIEDAKNEYDLFMNSDCGYMYACAETYIEKREILMYSNGHKFIHEWRDVDGRED